ncbi:MAG TPA: glycoside hydrolase family 2 TIM barrel-domain containing protein [Chitinophagaceae bacterium]|jgi:beta-galactosidase|nr:glycoside hydrolase family 2 TIM barrel-domain containing protein [Chitinophagaceae bacterium]
MVRYLRIFILPGFLSLFSLSKAVAQPDAGRIQFSVNDGWKFLPDGAAYAETVQFNDAGWEPVSLPHTWNAEDPFDDDRTYRRGISWYRKKMELPPLFKSKKVWLWFEGANQVTQVYVNGYFAGMHKGGYTGFAIDITSYLQWNDQANTIAVQVNNAHDPFIAPLNVGYASYGGIYRDVWIIATDNIHFKDINNNSSGVYITTPLVSKGEATVAVKSIISNETGTAQTVKLINTLYDKNGALIDIFSEERTVSANSSAPVTSISHTLKNPELWSPEKPALYKLISRLVTGDKQTDIAENKIGFRWFSFDPDNGFILNGQKLVLKGTNRHQDMKGKGDALSQDDHRRDMHLIKDMGCNFLRLAHYPQAPGVLKLADELGLLIWEEVPVVNFVTNNDEFVNNTERMIREMITQGYNHPSVILWGSSNEILLHGADGERIGRHTDTGYIPVVRKYAALFDSTVRAEDPSRYSTLAMHISGDYAKYGFDTISQVAGYNIYSGWYSGKAEDFGNDLDRRKRKGHNVFVSEYGAEGEVRLNTENPVRFDYTGQYQRYYHESYLRQINQRSWLAGTAVWNEFDFSQPNIGGPAPHMNQKGLVTWDRKPKDVYYMYKANWNPEPMVYIATRDWLVRAGEKNKPSTIDVYANAEEVTLYVNGVAQKTIKGNDVRKFSWPIQLKDGKNSITASGKINGKIYSDNVVVEYRTYNADLSGFTALSVNAGSNAQYTDASGTLWIEDRAYQKESFGYIAGKPKMFDRKDVIKNTDDEPLFYTCLDSLSAYRFDLADGNYAVTLFFAEPQRLKTGERVFDILINEKLVCSGLDLTASAGFAVAIRKTFMANVINGKGMTIRFDAKKGNGLLNGIKIEKQ